MCKEKCVTGLGEMCKEKCVTALGEMCKEKCVNALGEMCKEKCVTILSGIANLNANQNGNGDLEEIKEVNANCILMTNLQQASTSGTQIDKDPVYDSDGSTENDNNVMSAVSNMEQSRGITEQNPATVEETHGYFESIYNNLAIEDEKVNTVNRKMKETKADLTTELARYKNQEKCFEINQEKYDKLERCYQKYVYQEKCLTKKINALHLSSAKMIMTLNEETKNLNNQLSKEKSTVSCLQQEKKKLKSDFKTCKDELLDKQLQIENKIKELDNIFEDDESLAKHKTLEYEIERLLKEVVSQDIMSIVQSNYVVDTSNLQTQLERTKERSRHTAKTRRPQPRSNKMNDRVPFEFKSSCIKNKEVEVEEHHRNLLLSKNKKHMSSECNNIKLVIRNDKYEVVCAMFTNGIIKVLPPKTAEEVVARERERKAKTTLLMALPEDHLAKFHKMADAKEMWEAIRSRFEGLHKGYDRFQTLLSQLEIHGAGVLHEDANKKFLRIFISAAYSVSSLSVLKSQKIRSSSYTDEINDDDIEVIDLKWHVAMISMRIKKFHKRTGRKLQFDTKDPVGFDKTKVECFNCHKMGYFARDCNAKENQDSRRRDVGYNRDKTKDNGRRHAYQDVLAVILLK
nr:ribonuclease H-like domain-containing protein [Tanacetum cinerariifolium]